MMPMDLKLDLKKLFAVLVVGGSALGLGAGCGSSSPESQKLTAGDGGTHQDSGTHPGAPKGW